MGGRRSAHSPPAEVGPEQSPRALHEIHFPSSDESQARAREALVLAEFFAMQMLLSSRRARSRARERRRSHCGPGELLERFLRALPFDLTNAQARVIEELRGDLQSTIPMNRLLQGDVGSGKTVVAVAAMLLAVEAGFQAALMAPTQILAEQHYAVLQRWLEPLGVPVSLAHRRAQRRSAAACLRRRVYDLRGAHASRVLATVSRRRELSRNRRLRKTRNITAGASRISKHPGPFMRSR